jgi:lipid kinase YegS
MMMESVVTSRTPHTPVRPRTIFVLVRTRDAGDERLRAAIHQIRTAGHTVAVRVTWELDDIQRYIAEADAAAADAIVAAGGDGTIHHVVNGLLGAVEEPCAIGIIPMGTGNDLASCCGFDSHDPASALALTASGTPVPVDIITVGDQAVLNMATGGPGTQITENTPSGLKRLLGKAAYALTGISHLVSLEAEQVTLRGPGFTWEGACYVLAIGNGRQAGGGMQLCPRAVLDDGLLDVLVVPEMPQAKFLAVLAAIRQGTHLERDDMIYRQLPWVELTALQPIQLNMDGEPHDIRDARLSVRQRCLPMYLPPQAPLTAHAASTVAPSIEPVP